MAGEYIEFNNSTQPAVNDTNLNRLQQLIKQDMHSAVSGDTLPVGAIMPFGSNTIPENWLLCDGSAVSRTTYQYLFNTIGTTYGAGDGFTTFNLPDLRGKVVIGLDDNDTDFDTLGDTGGEKEHTLTIQEMPSHNHILTNGDNNIISEGEGGATASITTTGQGYRKVKLASTGGGEAHNILQPYIVQNYIIKANQSSGVLATVVDNLNSTSSTDALSANQGKALKEMIQGIILFSDNQGTKNDSINFTGGTISEGELIEIIFGRLRVGDGSLALKTTGKLYYFSGMVISLDINYNAAGGMETSAKRITVNSTGITTENKNNDNLAIKEIRKYSY